MRLLLVEDDLDLAALLRLVLGQAGYEVVLTDRVAGVVDRAVGMDGVVTDGALLDGTADDVLAALEADPRTAALPVVVCSVRPDAIQHRQVVGRLRKPLDPATTAQELRRLFADESQEMAPVEAAPAGHDEEATLRQRGLQELEVRARLIGDAGAAILIGDLTDERREQARVAAHRSIGLAGALGESDLAEPAKRAEQLLLTDGDLEVADAVALCEIAARLEDEARTRVDSAPEREARAAARRLDRGVIAIVDDDEVLVALVRRRLERATFQASTG